MILRLYVGGTVGWWSLVVWITNLLTILVVVHDIATLTGRSVDIGTGLLVGSRGVVLLLLLLLNLDVVMLLSPTGWVGVLTHLVLIIASTSPTVLLTHILNYRLSAIVLLLRLVGTGSIGITTDTSFLLS